MSYNLCCWKKDECINKDLTHINPSALCICTGGLKLKALFTSSKSESRDSDKKLFSLITRWLLQVKVTLMNEMNLTGVSS